MGSPKRQLEILSGDPKQKPSLDDTLAMPSHMIPSYRTMVAVNDGVENNLLFNTWGGLGDQICAEPMMRYAVRKYKGKNKLTLASPYPELFKHLAFDDVINTDIVHPIWNKYLVFSSMYPSDHLSWEFFSHCIVNCVDHASLNALRLQLPVHDKEIYLSSSAPDIALLEPQLKVDKEKVVFVHAGKTWPSRTFPKDWWDDVLDYLIAKGLTPVLIGHQGTNKTTTVDVDSTGCVDLRGKLSRTETIWLLQRAKTLLTNDSSPLHMAASTDPTDHHRTGYCNIGYIATCKHPDYITHWRKGAWQYRETNLGKGGMWDLISDCPNQKEEVLINEVDEKLLRTWLPKPEEVAEWAATRI